LKSNNFFIFIKSIFMLQAVIFIIISGITMEFNRYYIEDFIRLNMKNIIVPFSNFNINTANAASLFKEANVLLSGGQINLWFSSSNYVKKIPESIIASNFPVMAYGSKDNISNTAEKAEPVTSKTISKLEDKQIDYSSTFKGYKVIFYCTHSAESYIPDSGKARCDGQRGLVNEVAKNISHNLKKSGLNSEFIDIIHDYPEYNKSYTNSRNTVKKVLDDSGKTILALFDIHRDSIPGSTNADTIEIRGKPAAPILIIIGTDERKSHPNWQKNLKFAEMIYNQAEIMYPGLIKGIRTKAGTYNQEFHNHSLLLEFGTDYNSLAQAIYSGELFAEILLEVLKEDIN